MVLDQSEESQSMLQYSSGVYIKPEKIKDVCADIENNNENSVLQDEKALAQYLSNKKGVFAQCLVTGAVLLLTAGGGMPIGYSAILLPQLSENNSIVPIDRDTGSWIASVHSLATPVGSLFSGPLLDPIGRRGCLQLSAIPLILGWIVMGFAEAVPWILAGRVVSGLSVGFMAVPSQVLLGEMADPGLRGFLVGWSFTAYCFGILLIYAFGAFFTWNTVAFCGTVLPVVALIALCLIPESPAWLVGQKKIEAARKALLWLRGNDMVQVNAEISILEARAKADIARSSMNTSFSKQISSAISTLLEPSVLKPLMIINIFNVLQLTSGTYIVVFYAVDLVKDIEGDGIDHYLVAVVTALVRFVFCMVACILLLKLGRRVLGISSAVGTSLASLVLAGYMSMKGEDSIIDNYVLGICVFIYVGANTVGLLILPGLMITELLPQRARGIGGGCNFFIFNFLLFIVTKSFPMVSSAVNISGVFTIFGVSALLEAVFIYIVLPETKNLTLQQIEDYFQQDNMLWITRKR